MFRFFGAMIQRTWPIWLVFWPVALAALYWTAPPWDEVAEDREFALLPADAPTREGGEMLREAFPDDKRASNVVIVISRDNARLGEQDRDFVKTVIERDLMHLAREEGGLADQLAQAARSEHRTARTPIIAAIRTPDDPGSGPLLISDDRKAVLVVLELSTELLEQRNGSLLDKIQTLMNKWQASDRLPAGLQLHLFGSAVVGHDLTQAQSHSAHSTEVWTVIIVIIILVLVYRAPFLALIPLASVFIATQTATYILAHLAAAGVISLFQGVEVYITIILYGTGVDYCLFLIARYREVRCGCDDCSQAMAHTIRKIGPALTASAATVIFGIGMMAFAQFGKFHDAGIAIAISLAVSLCVVLTFTTSLLRSAGRLAYWPHSLSPSHSAENGLRRWFGWLSWDSVGNALMRHPGPIWGVAVLLMAPLAVGGIIYRNDLDYNFLGTMPPDSPCLAGAHALEAHFPAGATGIVTALLYEPHDDFLIKDSRGQIRISALTHYLAREETELEIADVRSWSRPLGTGWAFRRAAGEPLEQIVKGKKEALRYYVSHIGKYKGKVTRFELVMLPNPMSPKGIAWLNNVEDAFRAELADDMRDGKLYFLGTTANMRDLRRITADDQIRIQFLVIACVSVILMILLRSILVSVYLIASVLFSYFAALGATMAVFWWLDPAGFHGLDWKVPIFLFTILVAIGEDYNIFLMTRVHEEQAEHGTVEGIHVALVKTGRIITSCGIIMAGTFASLLAAPMLDLREMGFALAFGVLIDTFVVRPVLAPAFLIMVERGRLLLNRLTPLMNAKPKQPVH